METGQKTQKNGRIIRKTTIENYQALLKNLELFQLEMNIILRIKDFEQINTTRESIAERKYWKRFYFSFTEFLYYKKDVHDNYVGSQIKLLRAFFNYLVEEENPNPGYYHKQFYVTNQETPIIVLVPERLNFLIYNKDFENSLPKRLQIIKDMFVFGCTTALRFGDLQSLNRTNLETINTRAYLCTRSQKTNMISRVYLPDYAKDILAKYKRRKRSLFPPISNVNFNIAIKKIAFLAGWTEDLTVTKTKRGEHFEKFKDAAKKEHFRFCDILASHSMRRTAITTLLQMGMNEMNVRIISGHKANSTSFYRYVNYSDSFMDDEMESVFEKLKSYSIKKEAVKI